METASNLTPRQGYARDGFGGTCGLCSVTNILRLAGVDVTEGDVIDYASTTTSEKDGSYLCGIGGEYASNGGTNAYDRKEILSHFGIDSSTLNPLKDSSGHFSSDNLNIISDAVSSGKGVILSVDAGRLWDDVDYLGGYHAITVTSVKKDSSGNVLGFFIHDSAFGETKYYPAQKVLDSLSGNPMNITQNIIR